jgi:hypothetical protein
LAVGWGTVGNDGEFDPHQISEVLRDGESRFDTHFILRLALRVLNNIAQRAGRENRA